MEGEHSSNPSGICGVGELSFYIILCNNDLFHCILVFSTYSTVTL